MNLVLANRGYGPAGMSCGHRFGAHTTNEGAQLQLGLESAGWTLAGYGYDDNCCDVADLIIRHRPSSLFVQDVRDWSPDSGGCFDKRLAFTSIDALAGRPCFVATVVKDAGTAVEYQRDFCRRICADAIVVYYHPRSVLAQSPWLSDYPLVRTWHTVDADVAQKIAWPKERKRGLVSGAVSGVYPLRQLAFNRASSLRIDTLKHPGYAAKGCHTNDYLKTLAGYRVHVATASRYGFALRKIIESVAMGATVVTDLPQYDRLPVIDDALIRVPAGCDEVQLQRAIDRAERAWDEKEARRLSEAALEYYDYRAMGSRLSAALDAVRTGGAAA